MAVSALNVSMDVPRTQNTAPVLEFRCLFTPDLRRKQKRWQDGRLKFHTFNKRVMVYDDRSNFVGDTHWRKEYDFDDGEELELDRGAIMVEVGECIGKSDQDLTELVDKRVKEREERVAAKNSTTPMRPQASLNGPQTPAGSALLRPKPLNAILGNPTGHYGKAAIPNLSPFEQRNQAMRDKNENVRPAKRQKQDDAPPSKSGYAQNLMGVKLTLAPSMPPSTAAIKYEPLRIHRTPAATIDLTEDEEDQGTVERMRMTIPGEERITPKPRRQRTNTLARSGYASSLTGASLNLKGPEGYSSRRSASGLSEAINRFHKYQTQEIDLSSTAESRSLMEDQPAEGWPAERRQKQKEPEKKKPKPPLPILQRSNRYSSPSGISRAAINSKPSKTLKNSVIQDFSARRLMADQPVSTLRIKSRAPRKMMMLMDRPVCRSPAPTELTKAGQKGPKGQHGPRSPQNFVITQEPVPLGTFQEHQEWRLVGCLNGRRPDTSSSNLSSSCADSEITHHMMESLPSQKTKPTERAGQNFRAEMLHSKPAPKLARNNEDEEAAQVELPQLSVRSTESITTSDSLILADSRRSPPELDTNKCPELQTEGRPENPGNPKMVPKSSIPNIGVPVKAELKQSVSPITETVAMADFQRLGIDASTRKTDLDLQAETAWNSINSPRQNELEKSVSSHGLECSQSDKQSSKTISSYNVSKITSLQSRSPLASSLAVEVNEPNSHVIHAAIEKDSWASPIQDIGPDVAVHSGAARPKVSSLPADIGSAIVSTTPHFRAIIKSSASLPIQAVQDSSPAPSKQPVLPPASIPEAQKLDSASIAIKAWPKPSSMVATIGDDSQPTENVDSATRTHNSSNASSLIVPYTETDRKKPKLINPATRGLSVQMTASRTVNALAPALSGLPTMAPPPQCVSSRPGRIPAQDEALANRAMREPGKEVTPGGPWSRESFDLFGSWRDPGRFIGTTGITG